jgi:type IV pilus assembly protein PilV
MRTRARGFTLVESLIALVVLSLGLLGAGTMLLDSLRSHADALRQIAATGLARDMAERIRANPRARDQYDSRYAAASVATCETFVPCDATQLAAADRAHFIESAQALLPRAGLTVSVKFEPAIGPAAPDRYLITLQFRAAHELAQDGEESSDTVTLRMLAAPVAG